MSFFDLKARRAAAAPPPDPKAVAEQNANKALQPWIEKYRPKSLSDVTAQDHTTSTLQRYMQADNLPNMLFYGPPGTGKTSTILALAKSLFGPSLFHSRVLELNASDERGISIVRTKIKDFARMQLTRAPTTMVLAGGENEGGRIVKYTERYPCPPYKIIILDEADSMTQDAQSALRRTMETSTKITRFCLVCNYVTRIIDPVASRCAKFRFKSMEKELAGDRVKKIADKEGVPLADGAVEALIRCSEGDLRKAITYLQSAARLVGAVKAPPTEDSEDAMDIDSKPAVALPVTVRIVEDIAGVIPKSTIQTILKSIQPASPGITFERVHKCVGDLVADGWSAGQLVTQLYQELIEDDKMEDKHKMMILGIFSEIDKRLVDGADEGLNVEDLCLRVAKVLTTKA